MSVMNRSQEYDPQITQISFGLWEVIIYGKNLRNLRNLRMIVEVVYDSCACSWQHCRDSEECAL
jgi:hypothetical protein